MTSERVASDAPLNSADIDVGGTFTDAVLTLDGQRWIGKAPTTPYDLSVCFVNAIEEVALEAGQDLESLLPRLDVIRYSTTVADEPPDRTARTPGRPDHHARATRTRS